VQWRSAEEGNWTDLSDAFAAGTPKSPLKFEPWENGALRICRSERPYSVQIFSDQDFTIDIVGIPIELKGDKDRQSTLPTLSGQSGVLQSVISFTGENWSLSMENLRITRGRSTEGGGLLLSGGRQLSVTGCFIDNNIATGASTGGGGVHLSNIATVSIEQTTLNQNQCLGSECDGGGGIIEAINTLWISESKILDNTAIDNAGGLQLSEIVDGEIDQSTFDGNFTYDDGGGIHITNSNLFWTGGAFAGNTAIESGGALILHGTTSQLELSGVDVWGNEASFGGGLRIHNGADLCNSNTQVHDNIAPSIGGAGTRLTHAEASPSPEEAVLLHLSAGQGRATAGAPLFTADGLVVAVVASGLNTHSGGGVLFPHPSDIGFAIRIDELRRFRTGMGW